VKKGITGYFQQYIVTAHTADNSMDAISEVFKDQIISEGFLHPRLTALSYVNFISGET
jgi:hypothetical protein